MLIEAVITEALLIANVIVWGWAWSMGGRRRAR